MHVICRENIYDSQCNLLVTPILGNLNKGKGEKEEGEYPCFYLHVGTKYEHVVLNRWGPSSVFPGSLGDDNSAGRWTQAHNSQKGGSVHVDTAGDAGECLREQTGITLGALGWGTFTLYKYILCSFLISEVYIHFIEICGCTLNLKKKYWIKKYP